MYLDLNLSPCYMYMYYLRLHYVHLMVGSAAVTLMYVLPVNLHVF